MTNTPGWYISQWSMVHPVHGVFTVDVLSDGDATAKRIHGRYPHFSVEDIGGATIFEDADDAMSACETRLAELERNAKASGGGHL